MRYEVHAANPSRRLEVDDLELKSSSQPSYFFGRDASISFIG